MHANVWCFPQGNTHQARDGGYSIYKRISEGGMAYLDRTSVGGFHGRFPMSAKAKSVLTNHLNVIKAQAQTYVEVRNGVIYTTGRY